MIYPLLRKYLFSLNPETAHTVTLQSLNALQKIGLTHLFPKAAHLPRDVMGMQFPNAIGLAAGLDKNGDYIDALAALGFGFIEVGTVTPKPQPGNPLPRLFRLVEQEALINRLGFNNKGVEYLVERLKKTKFRGILGINIGKNKQTPIEYALQDYQFAMRRVAPYASYITINISSPNTENLRQLQHGELLTQLLKALKREQALLDRYVPLVVKISPDVTREELMTMADIFLAEKVDGVIATNTTLAREGVLDSPYANESGGLSGKPLAKRSTDIIRELYERLNTKIPIIACGGIMNADDAKEKYQAGARLLQVYTGLIYRGPGLVRELSNVIE